MSGYETIEDNTDPISSVQNRLVSCEAVARTTGEPRLAYARRTFAALVASAANPPLRLLTDFQITGIGELRTTELERFSIADHRTEREAGFTIAFRHVGRDPLKYVCESKPRYEALHKSLFELGLTFKSAASETASKIVIEPVVPAALSVSYRRAGGLVTLTLSNVAALGERTYEMPAERFDRRIVDALVDMIVSGSRTFYQLAAAATAQHPRR